MNVNSQKIPTIHLVKSQDLEKKNTKRNKKYENKKSTPRKQTVKQTAKQTTKQTTKQTKPKLPKNTTPKKLKTKQKEINDDKNNANMNNANMNNAMINITNKKNNGMNNVKNNSNRQNVQIKQLNNVDQNILTHQSLIGSRPVDATTSITKNSNNVKNTKNSNNVNNTSKDEPTNKKISVRRVANSPLPHPNPEIGVKKQNKVFNTVKKVGSHVKNNIHIYGPLLASAIHWNRKQREQREQKSKEKEMFNEFVNQHKIDASSFSQLTEHQKRQFLREGGYQVDPSHLPLLGINQQLGPIDKFFKGTSDNIGLKAIGHKMSKLYGRETGDQMYNSLRNMSDFLGSLGKNKAAEISMKSRYTFDRDWQDAWSVEKYIDNYSFDRLSDARDLLNIDKHNLEGKQKLQNLFDELKSMLNGYVGEYQNSQMKPRTKITSILKMRAVTDYMLLTQYELMHSSRE